MSCVITVDEPSPLGADLGCDRDEIGWVARVVIRASLGHAPLPSSQPRTTNSRGGGFCADVVVQGASPFVATFGPQGGQASGIWHEMNRFMEQFLEVYVGFANISRSRLKAAATSSLKQRNRSD